MPDRGERLVTEKQTEALEKLNQGIQESRREVQQRTMNLAQEYFGDSAEALKQQIRDNRAMLEGLPDQIPGGREEAFQALFQELVDNYASMEECINEAQQNVARLDTDQIRRQGEIDATDAARREARERGIDLTKIKGTGSDGRIIVSDVVEAAEAMEAEASEDGAASEVAQQAQDAAGQAAGQAQQVAGQATDQAGQVAGQVQDTAGQAVGQAQDTVGQATDQAGQAVQGVQDTVGGLTGGLTGGQQQGGGGPLGGVTDQVGQVAQGVQDTAGQATQQVQDTAGQVTDQAGQVAGQATDQAGQAAQQARDTAGQAAGQAQDAVGQAAQQAAGQATGGDGAEEPRVTNAARRKAQELGVDLSTIRGTGSGGLITLKDVVGS
jgi:pyruvate/2-oxoglutarate dehydrogenase complex dihydrolipoamide acyltransferase (E2) component